MTESDWKLYRGIFFKLSFENDGLYWKIKGSENGLVYKYEDARFDSISKAELDVKDYIDEVLGKIPKK